MTKEITQQTNELTQNKIAARENERNAAEELKSLKADLEDQIAE